MADKKKVAVILSGCGYLDGSEAQETIFTLLALDAKGAEYYAFAPEASINQVMDHQEKKPHDGSAPRNIRQEAARLTRGNVRNVAELWARDYDALVMPGGYGAAKNLCNYASHGTDCEVHPDVERVVQDFITSRKPVGAICIAPVLVARVAGKLKDRLPSLTIGNDEATARDIEQFGAEHHDCPPGEIIVDRKNRIVSTPAYMYESRPHEVFTGIQKLVDEVLGMADSWV